jgi:hypothetical protein
MKYAVKSVTLYDFIDKNKNTILFLLYNILLLSYNYWAINEIVSYFITTSDDYTKNNNNELTYNESIAIQDELYKNYNQMLNSYSPDYSYNKKKFMEIESYLYFCQTINLFTLIVGYLLRKKVSYFLSIIIAIFVKLLSVYWLFYSYYKLFSEIKGNIKVLPNSLIYIHSFCKLSIMGIITIIVYICLMVFIYLLGLSCIYIFNKTVNWAKTYKIQYIEVTQNDGINDV